MERGATEYSQSGLPPSYPAVAGSEAEAASIDQQPTAQYQPAPEVRPANFSSSGTPTSEYGMAPSSARSSTFPEYVGRGPYPDGAPRYHPPVNQSGAGAGTTAPSLASISTTPHLASPSLPLHPLPLSVSTAPPLASPLRLPCCVLALSMSTACLVLPSSRANPPCLSDPAIAATSPTYPPPAPYSPYPPQGEMASPYQGHPGPYPRPEWGGYPPQHPHGLPPAYGGHTSPSTTVSSGSPATNSGQRPQVRMFRAQPLFTSTDLPPPPSPSAPWDLTQRAPTHCSAGIFFRPDPWCAAAQASSASLRGD